MSPLQMFLPAAEPARSEALEMLRRTGRPPRHIVHAIARGCFGKRAGKPIETQQDQLQGFVPQAPDDLAPLQQLR